ncbi:AAA domain-containing protein [Natronorubrum sp. JWXQ-INN-674]|uniref:AAA domain-containing protein n=1 Tax=Natronorubrum halalkaliphilum TaxID=2691917 RepID=A0A6B0VPL5_9EURY|nr:MoxR family ATPase [Natronorubrum halalkaliphilum]MXV62479.1 AAA domain-containing protein [Natronorubrum halalkaliphilum]
MNEQQATVDCEAIIEAVSEAVICDRSFLEEILVGVVGRGHVLLEDVPGTGKTLTARTVATALGLSFSRIQFTPDLLPADVTGTHIFNEQDRAFEFSEGPIFANIVLADEINRAPPKTQAALLEAMEEGQVTVDGETRQLPDPFFVIATQNPVEQEGTFPLPEAQVDRFLVKTSMGYPDETGEVELLRRRASRETTSPTVEPVLEPEEVSALRRAPETVRIDDDLLEYIAALARSTRTDGRVETGVSPRGTQRLFEAVRAYAVITGREYVTPDDIKRVAKPVLAHRLVLTPDATVNAVDKERIIESVLESVPVPTLE